MSHAAKQIGLDEIPVIDISADEASVAADMLRAAEASGFFYIRNHGVPQALIDQVLGLSHRFFSSPIEAKRAATVNEFHRGFIRAGEAKMYAGATPDLKESFIWGLDDATDAGTPDAHGTPPNVWPEVLPELRPVLAEFFTAGNAVGWRLLRSFALSLGQPPDRFIRSIAHPTSRGSMIYYPPQPPGAEQFGVSPHTDWGCLTLLYQDQTGGLEVRGSDGAWVTAHPIPGTFVVNVGDLLARWTNDRFKSTPHRVVNRSGRERLSCAIFVDPDRDTEIDPVLRPGETARHEPVTCGAYVQSRFDAAFAYRQKE